MRQHVHPGRRIAAGLTSFVLAASALAVAAQPASADTAPVDPALPETVAADSLPTVQIDGVAWDQEIVGNRVYVVGSFTTARPAGAAPGTSTVPRANMLAYDLTTGALITSFAPTLNAQARSLSVSPDGTRLYVGGEFTQVNGVTRYRVAAFNAATGALLPFAPVINGRVAAVEATNTSVYVGGIFSQIGSASRVRIAQIDAATSQATAFTATPADGQVAALALSPDGSTLVIGGNFTAVDGSDTPGYGLARLNATTGALLPTPVNGLIRNAGDESAIYALDADEQGFYGTGYTYGGGGNLEGAFAASWDGALRWVEDCHGDSYDVYASGPVTYTVGHPHYCATVDGYPQTEPWTAQYANAFTNFVTGPVGRNLYTSYYQFQGQPGPSLLTYFPTFLPGAYTGQSQATWTVTGNGDYVVYGGEFTYVNNVRQQGLVRMATKEIAPNKQGPRLAGAAFTTSATSLEAGQVRIAWTANWDRDNETLTYRVHRGTNATVVNEQTVTAKFWDLPQLGFVDTGVAPGSTQQYRVSARDAFGNTVYSEWVPVTVSSDGALTPYAEKVLADGARSFWRLGEASGPTVRDWAGYDDALALSGVSRGAEGALAGDPDTAATFDGTDNGRVVAQRSQMSREAFTVEAWFRTTTRAGGKIVGFGNTSTGNSSRHDRNLYMNTSGQVLFGVIPGGAQRTLQSPTALNDGKWHHVAGTLGAQGMSMYVDGKRVSSRADTVVGQAFNGFWHIGGDSTWSGSRNFAGVIDDVAVYDRPLTAEEIDSHVVLSGRSSAVPAAPADAYGTAVYGDAPDLFWRLGETSGTTAGDSGVRNITGAYRNGVVLGQASGIVGTTNTSARFDGVNDTIGSNVQFVGPASYTQELWFSTTSTAGGKLIGFGNASSGLSTSFDRHVYLDPSGQITFGAYPGTEVKLTTPTAYNDGAWHHLVAAQSSAGMRLYVDGVLVGSNAQAGAEVYNGYWRVGGDATWGGVQPYLAARIDEVAVYGRALTLDEVREHYTLGSGATPANAAPLASFAAAPGELVVAVDGSASADPDGTVASHAWTFGDGGTATGATANHTYAAAGDYTVTLTVTDDKGATGSTSQQVTVTAPPPNVPPVASFTSSTTDLGVTVDGSASSDPDGSVAAHAWTFGDGATATGATASHQYAAAGTYTVTLRVTDDDGATHERTAQVTVTDPPVVTVLARDLFDRTVTNGWGGAATGGVWTLTTPASGFSVTGGTATQRLATPGSGTTTYLNGVSSTDTDLTLRVVPDQEPTGGGVYVSVLGRRVDGANDYRAVMRLLPGGKVTLQLQRNGATLTSGDVAGVVSKPGQPLAVRLQVTGTAPTTIRAKAWVDGTPEPEAWRLTATDTTAALQVPGSIGLSTYLSGSATTVPTTIGFRDLWAGRTQ